VEHGLSDEKGQESWNRRKKKVRMDETPVLLLNACSAQLMNEGQGASFCVYFVRFGTSWLREGL